MDLLTIAFVALVVTKLVDTARNVIDPKGTNIRLKPVWNGAAFGLGIVAAYLFEAAGLPIVGQGDTPLATGLLIGAAASGWHEVLDRISPTAP